MVDAIVAHWTGVVVVACLAGLWLIWRRRELVWTGAAPGEESDDPHDLG